jgi:hypothetical protein
MMEQVLDFLNNPILKGAMVFIGTWLLRRWGRFINQAIPFWTGLYSIVTALIGGLFPGGTSPSSMGEGFMVAAAGAGPWWQHLLVVVFREGILPWLTGFGGARALGQAREHATGAVIPVDTTSKPIEAKPFQTLLTPPQEKKIEAAKED